MDQAHAGISFCEKGVKLQGLFARRQHLCVGNSGIKGTRSRRKIRVRVSNSGVSRREVGGFGDRCLKQWNALSNLLAIHAWTSICQRSPLQVEVVSFQIGIVTPALLSKF